MLVSGLFFIGVADMKRFLLTALMLVWASGDNGRDIAWDDAKSYCSHKGAGWRLPEVAELESLSRGKVTAHLSGSWLWSATEVSEQEASDAEDVAWGVQMINGVRTQNLRPIAFGARALCVKGA
jgi:hypothetical protein